MLLGDLGPEEFSGSKARQSTVQLKFEFYRWQARNAGYMRAMSIVRIRRWWGRIWRSENLEEESCDPGLRVRKKRDWNRGRRGLGVGVKRGGRVSSKGWVGRKEGKQRRLQAGSRHSRRAGTESRSKAEQVQEQSVKCRPAAFAYQSFPHIYGYGCPFSFSHPRSGCYFWVFENLGNELISFSFRVSRLWRAVRDLLGWCASQPNPPWGFGVISVQRQYPYSVSEIPWHSPHELGIHCFERTPERHCRLRPQGRREEKRNGHGNGKCKSQSTQGTSSCLALRCSDAPVSLPYPYLACDLPCLACPALLWSLPPLRAAPTVDSAGEAISSSNGYHSGERKGHGTGGWELGKKRTHI
ncbi:hypothetical protein CaCOL14_007670 [Colletotrichum acutatum]